MLITIILWELGRFYKLLGKAFLWYLIVSIPDLCNLTYFKLAVLKKRIKPPDANNNYSMGVGQVLQNY